MKTCLVTGGAGFIGSHIVEALIQRGDRVRVFDNLSTGNLRNLKEFDQRIELIRGDITDPAAVATAVNGIDCVFHNAGLVSIPLSIDRPMEVHAAFVTGTLNLLDQAHRAGVRRVVYAASSSAYGNRDCASKRETDLPAPASPYAAAKIAGELYCQAFTRTYGLETVALRYFNAFGPRQNPQSQCATVIPTFITAMLAGLQPTVFGRGDQSRDFVFVADIVHGNLLAADAPDVAGQVFNIGSGTSATLLDIIKVLNNLLGTSLEPHFTSQRSGDVHDTLADLSRARQYLGYEPQFELTEGLRRSIEYYCSAVCQ